MKVIIGLVLGLVLVSATFVNNPYAYGGDQIWLVKTKRGIDISCPPGFMYEEEIIVSCKADGTAFNAFLHYNDLYLEGEFFNEKDILKEAIIGVKTLPDVKIVEKKTA